MPAVDVIKRNAKSYVLTRPGTDAITDGLKVPGATTDIDIEAVIQQMTPKELRNLPPGQNSGEWINIWTETLVKMRDQVTYGGVLYTIQRVAFWEDPYRDDPTRDDETGPFYICNASHTQDVLP